MDIGQIILNIFGYAFILEIALIIILEVMHKRNAKLLQKYQRNNLKQMIEFENALREVKERLAKEGKTPEEIKKETIPGTPTMEELMKKYGHLFQEK
jgi:hypothetical protein